VTTVANEAGDDVVVDVRAESEEGPPTEPTAPVETKKPNHRVAIGIGITIGLSALALWFLLYSLVLTGFQEHGSQARLYEKFRVQLAEETAPLGAPIKVGAPVAMINAKESGIHNLIVVEGSTARQLIDGPGHLSNTPLPGQFGTSVILGRSVTYGAPFGEIVHMRTGDVITVTTGQGVFTYRVQDIRYPGATPPPTILTNQSRLTLVTSASNGWRSGWAPTETVYVDTILQHGQAQPVPPGLSKKASPASMPMQGSPNALLPLSFWIEALVVAAAAIAWSWARWGRRQTWLVGVPILLAIMWGSTNALVQFLPNVM
jgi:sortase A